MRGPITRAAMLVLSGLLLAGCGSDASDGGATTTTPAAELRPADEVIAEQQRTVPLGKAGDLGLGVSVTVSEPLTVRTDKGGAHLVVPVRAENRGTLDTLYRPQLAIVCAGSTDSGGTLSGQTYRSSDELPAGSFAEGEAWLLLPGDDRTGEAVAPCDGPASITANAIGRWPKGDAPEPVRFRIPDSILADLNEAASS